MTPIKRLTIRCGTLLSTIAAVFALLAAIVPRWIETVTSLSPDAGSGEAEWELAFAFGAAAVVTGVLTYAARRRWITSVPTPAN